MSSFQLFRFSGTIENSNLSDLRVLNESGCWPDEWAVK